MPQLVEYAKTLPDVVVAENSLYTCSSSGLDLIKKSINEHKLTRMVVASCTPRTHEPLFRSACHEAGLNPFLFEMVNIREHCSWCHADEPKEKSMARAKDQIRMGVARAGYLEPQEEIEIDVDKNALVIGGGVSGMTAALNLAFRNFHVFLVEKEKELGGILLKLNRLAPANIDAKEYIQNLARSVKDNKNINVFTDAEVTSINGYIGNFDIALKSDNKEMQHKVGVIIAATGADVLTPEGKYNYDGKRVVTQLELEDILSKKSLKAKNIVMIQCVGAMGDERTYCSRMCCATAIKNALIIKELNPDSEITILYREMQTYGDDLEEQYREARKRGVVFARYSLESKPEVKSDSVEVFETTVGEKIKIAADIVVLSTPMISRSDSETVAKMLKVPRQQDGFFLEAHVKLRPLDFATDGIFLCGTCHWPKDVPDSITQACGAASRASIPLSKGRIKIEPIVSSIDKDKCIACGLCVTICPYKAIEMVDRRAQSIAASCKGCGLCAASCPQHAITMRHFTNNQIEAAIAALSE
ncbi:MAG: CoB--CoM heterodisulfide reductase iron-sulfur subunit A family protein [Planctomycetota bacterium]